MTTLSESNENKWEFCIDHYGDAVSEFFKQHFSEGHRKCLFIGSAGFDPRSNIIVKKLCPFIDKRIHIILIREKRSSSDAERQSSSDEELVKRAEGNIAEARDLYSQTEVLGIDIFAEAEAVVGGINISKSMEKSMKTKDITQYTDIVIDLSALSIGVSFPLVKYIYQWASDAEKLVNIHLTVTSNDELDSYISSALADCATDVRGFSIPNLLGEGEKAKLWLPLMSTGKKGVLSKIYDNEKPHDVCPIFPFPSKELRKGDKLAAIDFIEELESDWEVDPRNFLYADEKRPLDIYRTIMRINKQRKSVFETFGGSMLILSPLGSRMPAIGMLIAALEGGFPVVYVETLNYYVKNWGKVDGISEKDMEIAHFWLYGEAYYNDRKRFGTPNKTVDHE